MRGSFLRNSMLRAIFPALLSLFFSLTLHAAPPSPAAQKETLPDGVEHWYIPELPNSDSILTRWFKEIHNVVSFGKNEPPFGRSIAFLAGVSNYRYLSPQLLSVKNDVADMRDFLLNKAGFDEVYVAMGNIVNRNLIEDYVKNIIPDKMQKNDRLLFYYSGHGGDAGGDTGYMQFAGAEKDKFTGPQVLAVGDLKHWSSELKIRHALFILDSCSSGLGVAPKTDNVDPPNALLRALSGKGSRRVLTAGTGNEATYAEEREKTGRSFFTKALLNSFDSLSSNPQTTFITITELFAGIEKQMGGIRAEKGVNTTPMIWPLQVMDYPGTFVFLNRNAKGARLPEDQATALGVNLVPKGEGAMPANPASGIIEVKSASGGDIFLDGENKGYISPRQELLFRQISEGPHKVQMQDSEVKGVTVEGGKIAYVSFGIPAPLDHTGTVPVGSLEVKSTLQAPGDIYIDNYKVAHIEKNGSTMIADLLVGQHDCRIDAANQSQKFDCGVIRQNQTTPVTVAPPTNLQVTVH
jgi:Caspase domain